MCLLTVVVFVVSAYHSRCFSEAFQVERVKWQVLLVVLYKWSFRTGSHSEQVFLNAQKPLFCAHNFVN